MLRRPTASFSLHSPEVALKCKCFSFSTATRNFIRSWVLLENLGKKLPAFDRILSSGTWRCCFLLGACSAYISAWIWRQNVTSKCIYISIRVHGVTYQKTVLFIVSTVRTSGSLNTRFIIVFTRACQWSLPWATLIQSTSSHLIFCSLEVSLIIPTVLSRHFKLSTLLSFHG